MNSYTQVAQQVAIDAGRTIRSIFYRLERLNPEQEADDSLYKRFYEQIESELVEAILKLYPNHTIYASNLSTLKNDARFEWFISVSGEENFRARNPYFSVTLALDIDGETHAAVIYDPIADKVTAASRTDGVVQEDQRVRIEKSDGKIAHANILTRLSRDETQLARIAYLHRITKSVRVLGDLAQDTVLVGKGVYSGYFADEFDHNVLKAAALVAKEAGLLVTDFRGSENVEKSGTVVISHPRLLKEFLKALNQAG